MFRHNAKDILNAEFQYPRLLKADIQLFTATGMNATAFWDTVPYSIVEADDVSERLTLTSSGR
jgi:hypothetical protein